MGDRGNIVVLQHAEDETNPDQIWFYAHWRGSDMPEVLQTALRDGQGRWDDDGYLARIIFCRLVPKAQLLEETGFGIYSRLSDNEHQILVCDTVNQRVFTIEQDELTEHGRIPAGYKPKRSWTFKEYCDEKTLVET